MSSPRRYPKVAPATTENPVMRHLQQSENFQVPEMNESNSASFDDLELHAWLEDRQDDALDDLPFGVIGFDREGAVNRYNAVESRLAGLPPARVMGLALFTVVAPCMNNFLVAQRFEDAAAESAVLDSTIDYVLTLRMRPEKVRMRLLAAPGYARRYVLIERRR
jgi:photoactive yellow protein